MELKARSNLRSPQKFPLTQNNSGEISPSLLMDEIELKEKGWSLYPDQIEKTFRFENYRAAVDFVVRVAQLADKQNHHPEITLSYAWVKVISTTHDQGHRPTEKDFELGSLIEKMLP